jgi:hypothetical protein
MALLEFSASLPPFNTAALPDLKHNEKTSTVTFGRASYITPTTPSGTDLLSIFSPFFRARFSMVLPVGSGSEITVLMSAQIASILSGVSKSLSYSELVGDIFARSFAFALTISFDDFLRFFIKFFKTWFLLVKDSDFLEAVCAFLKFGIIAFVVL